MARVGIVTDSISCVPPQLVKEYDIRVIPYHLILEGKDYLDQIDITPAEFWRRFPTLKALPTTAAMGAGEYASTITELAKSTDSIVCITISRALSAAYEVATQARDIVTTDNPNLKIELVDSNNAVGAEGFVVLEAARAAQSGKSLAEVVKAAQALVPRVKFISALDTLKYLIKGGRAPKTAVIGEFLNVKPLIGIVSETGLVSPLGKERGKKKAMLKLVDLIKKYADTDKPLHVFTHHTDHIEDAEELKEMVTSRYNCAEVYMTDLTPVMTVHTGPSVGLSFYS